MLRAIIFDCDGVIADTEPIHLAALQQTLGEEGFNLTEADYYRNYLALDDRGCFKKAFSRSGIPLPDRRLQELIARKALYVEPAMREHLRLFAGVADFISRAAQKYPLAIASGALRREVEMVLELGNLRDYFRVVVSAEDVSESKPSPEPFLKALALLNAESPAQLLAPECLVIEDSFHGIEAAQGAGMRSLAVTNSYPEEKLSSADLVVESLARITIEEVETYFKALE